MKVGAIIAEYNPFHNGHKYQIEKFRRESCLDYLIIIMSGDFTQRGEPAWMPKHLRARMALEAGADLIIELPLYYATGSASLFAEGAIAHLNALGCVDELCFGCESDGDFNVLFNKINTAAEILIEEPELFKEKLTGYLRKGFSYPVAREKALSAILPDVEELFSPNNILAMEYVIALKKTKSSIIPRPIIRRGPGYHSTNSEDDFASATALRQKLTKNLPSGNVLGIPEESMEIIRENYGRSLPITINDFSSAFCRLYLNEKEKLVDYIDINEDIANLMRKNFDAFINLEQYLTHIKNKAYTYTRLSRCVIHMLTNQKDEYYKSYLINGLAKYARVLGFKKNASSLLNTLKQTSSISLITKMSVYREQLDDDGCAMLDMDVFAADVYRMTAQVKFGQHLNNEYNEKLVII